MQLKKTIVFAIMALSTLSPTLHAGQKPVSKKETLPAPTTPEEVSQRNMDTRAAVAEQLGKNVPVKKQSTK